MGWLKKIFKGSTHGTSEGQYRGKYEVDVVWNERSKTLEGPSNDDDEDEDEDLDLDHAIAVSLSEEERKGKAIDKKPQLEEDEQLARALHESLNANYPFNGIGQIYRPSPFSFLSSFRRCAGCHREITEGRFLNCMGVIWHPECLRCHACNNPISNNEFAIHGNRPYHTSCYRELRQPKCDVCKMFIPANFFGLIEYKAHPFWQQKYCPAHDYDRTPRCCSCERMEPRDMKYITLDDGRKLCLECLDSAIMDTNECQPLYQFIKEFYEGLNMKIEQQIPLLLVERQALNEAMESERNGTHHLPETRGLCLAEEQIVSVISRRPTIGPGNMITDILTRPYRLVRLCEVTAILILYGLPRLLTGTILAHEMMHAWMRLQGFRGIDHAVEEGICQVLAHMWLEAEIAAGSSSNSASSSSSSSSSSRPSRKGIRSQFEKKLGLFIKYQMESDTSHAYGDGFRAGLRAVQIYGLRRTLDHIRQTGIFP